MSRLPWLELGDGLPRYASTRLRTRVAQASSGIIRGSPSVAAFIQ